MSTDQPLIPPPSGITQESRIFAALSYASVMTGLPLFIIPLVQKTDAYAMFHARHAAVAYIGLFASWFLYFGLSIVTFGFGSCCFPIMFLAWIPAIHGILLAISDKEQEPIGTFGIAPRLFGAIEGR